MKIRKRGTVLMLSGILLLTAALSLTLYNLWDENRAGHTAQAAVEYLSVELAESSTDEFTPDYLLDPDRDLPTVEVAQQDYIGILTIPALGLELPVISQWSYPSLKAAPCRYAGSPTPTIWSSPPTTTSATSAASRT